MSRGGTLARKAAVLIGVLLLLIGYYWVHKPFSPEPNAPLNLLPVVHLLGALLDLLTAVLLGLVGGGLGWRVLSPLVDLDSLHPAERVGLVGAAGLGLLGLVGLGLGMLGLFSAPALWAALALVALVSLPGVLRYGALLRSLRPADPPRGLARFVALMLGAAGVLALNPPTAWDATMYHLVGPQAYLRAGALVAVETNHYLGFPQGVEMLYTWAMGLWGRETAAAPLHFVFGGLGLLALGGLAARRVGTAVGWWAVALLLSSYSLWRLFGVAYVDLAVVAYSAVALGAALRWRETDDRRWLIVAGLAAGLAVGVKYTAGTLPLALAAFVLISDPRHLIANLAALALPALLIFAPWLLRGALYYGNPIYPLLFDGLNWDGARAAAFFGGGGLLNGPDAWQIAVVPLAATFLGIEGGPVYSFTAGPWLLTAPLLLLIGWPWLDTPARQLARRVAIPIAALLILWVLLAAFTPLGGQTRLMAPLLPLMALAGALGIVGLGRWPRQPLDLAFIVRALLAVSLGVIALEALFVTVRGPALAFVLGAADRDTALTQTLGPRYAAMQRLADLPDGARVLLLWLPHAYHCPAHIACDADVLTDFWHTPLRRGIEPDAIIDGWRAAYDYALVWEDGLTFYSDPAHDPRFADYTQRFDAARADWPAPTWAEGGYTLYAWR